MKKTVFWASVFGVLWLTSCGPREIGEGTSANFAGAGMSVAEDMRLPMTGASNTQRMLYHYNRPNVMEQVQSWRKREFLRQNGFETGEPARDVSPAKRGPFRQ